MQVSKCDSLQNQVGSVQRRHLLRCALLFLVLLKRLPLVRFLALLLLAANGRAVDLGARVRYDVHAVVVVGHGVRHVTGHQEVVVVVDVKVRVVVLALDAGVVVHLEPAARRRRLAAVVAADLVAAHGAHVGKQKVGTNRGVLADVLRHARGLADGGAEVVAIHAIRGGGGFPLAVATLEEQAVFFLEGVEHVGAGTVSV
jgi:hypothetical protein